MGMDVFRDMPTDMVSAHRIERRVAAEAATEKAFLVENQRNRAGQFRQLLQRAIGSDNENRIRPPSPPRRSFSRQRPSLIDQRPLQLR
jgi:hypothetical protein